MEPLTTAAMSTTGVAAALATILSTKALEKIGENIGDAVSAKTKQFLEFFSFYLLWLLVKRILIFCLRLFRR
ncbi:hypothetical protein NIES4074_43260 [Cylindrospermum sp. NIES-4074]|nr:hypothetical protein NIES4074_43260 [Cylindrospermum sp. NIES-4074]